MKKTFQFRIYPTKNQEAALNRTLSTCRHLYNDSLEERKRQAEYAGKRVELVNPRNRGTGGTTGFQACLSNLNKEAMKQEKN
ncbi:Helix-turn-helix domain protein [uncultured archaeon]|nr:Helix-turn-helix domain protein [uncultured archaeon]